MRASSAAYLPCACRCSLLTWLRRSFRKALKDAASSATAVSPRRRQLCAMSWCATGGSNMCSYLRRCIAGGVDQGLLLLTRRLPGTLWGVNEGEEGIGHEAESCFLHQAAFWHAAAVQGGGRWRGRLWAGACAQGVEAVTRGMGARACAVSSRHLPCMLCWGCFDEEGRAYARVGLTD